MGMDIRLPMGLMFTVFGLLLSIFGIFSNRDIYRASLGINVNLLWGLVLLAFGIIMLLLGRRAGAVSERNAASTEKPRTHARTSGEA